MMVHQQDDGEEWSIKQTGERREGTKIEKSWRGDSHLINWFSLVSSSASARSRDLVAFDGGGA